MMLSGSHASLAVAAATVAVLFASPGFGKTVRIAASDGAGGDPDLGGAV